MKKIKATVYNSSHLIGFYKCCFYIFYWPCNLSASLNQKVSRMSHFSKKLGLFMILLNLIVSIRILYQSTCDSSDGHVLNFNFEMILILNAWVLIILLSSFFSHIDEFKNFWFKLQCLDIQILQRLNHKVDYKKFRNSFLLAILCPFLITVASVLRMTFLANRTPMSFRILIATMKILHLYIKFHAIFIVDLVRFIYQMFSKYVNFAYHLNRSNLLFPNINSIETNVKYYKEIHYKLWIITCEFNGMFGTSLTLFCFQTFIDIGSALFLIYTYYEKDNFFWMTTLLSTYLPRGLLNNIL